MILREFLYVDADKVRGLLAQLDDGIVEGTSDTTHQEKLTGAGLKGLAEHSQKWGGETTFQKSLGDAVFPTLEGMLESSGLLVDISEELADEDFWGEPMRAKYPPGTLVRITAPAALFDARYVSTLIAGFATTWQGLTNVGVFEKPASPPVLPPKAKAQHGGGQSPKQRAEAAPPPGVPRGIEEDIPDVTLDVEGTSISREYMQGIVRVARGIFSPGLHLNMLPAGSTTAIVTARLQEGRQFLDSDAEVLFARYGVGTQDWTLVGSIGHYGQGPVDDAPSIVNDDQSVNRAAFSGFINNFLLTLGATGYADLPQEPSFSVVPLAVYRVIGTTTEPDVQS